MHNNEMTQSEIDAIEDSGICPDCDGELDSGAGFGNRDLECSNCDFSISYPIDHFLARIRSEGTHLLDPPS